ncbi:tetratricopeptide repeat protein [Oceanicola sp. S124]|uniref:tetratricopeptide repeat protein n=1 Tax=Oceanicola sp. S124 TaxID=1042378 RepID=UPI00025584E5|nr:tetratricopeptide repeat protein [Oceanicola sp. S124]
MTRQVSFGAACPLRHLLGACALVLAGPFAARAAGPCLFSIDSPVRQSLVAAVSAAATPDVPEAAVLEGLLEGSGDFCSFYELGRYYGRLDDYGAAQTWLERAQQTSEQQQIPAALAFPTRNVLGFIALQKGDYDVAAEWFEAQLADLEALPETEQVKVLNNAGYTMIQLGRYDEAEQELLRASALGSLSAGRNLEALRSIQVTLESGAIDGPGAFGVALGAVAREADVETLLRRVKGRLDVPADSLGVFRTGTGALTVVLEPYSSYPKAQVLLREIEAQGGFNGPYVTSLSQWQDISVPTRSVALGEE